MYAAPGTHRRHAGLLGREHQVVEVALLVGEGARDRQRAGHVGGVERPVLHAHVEQHELSGDDRAVVLDPVQGGRVRSAGGDALVADVVAVRPGATPEGALDPALAVLHDVVPLANGVLEAQDRRVDRVLELLDLPRVLDETHLGEMSRQLPVRRAVTAHGDERVDVRVDAAKHARRPTTAQRVRQLVQVAAGEAEDLAGLGERAPASGPGLAVATVAPERVVALGVARPEVQRALTVVQHQHGVGRLVAGQVDVVRRGPEPVVGVVGARLQRPRWYDDPLTLEALGELGPALRGPRGDRHALDLVVLVGPAGAHELHERVAGRHRVRGGLETVRHEVLL